MALGTLTRRVALSTLGLTLVGGCVDINLDWEPPSDGASSDASAGDSDASTSTSAGATEAATDSDADTDGTGGDSVGMTSGGVTGLPGTTDEPGATTEPQTEPATTGEGEEVLYDFWLEHCALQWVVGLDPDFMSVSCNTADGFQGWEEKRFNQDVYVEGDTVFGRALLLSPPAAELAAISGLYGEVLLDKPAAFVADVACKAGGGPCDAEWQVVVWDIDSMEVYDVLQAVETNDGAISGLFLELTEYIGEPIGVSIGVISLQGQPGDELVWESPRIIAI